MIISTHLGYNSGEGNGTPLQYSCLENPMDGGAWWATVRGVSRSQTWLSDFTFTFHFHALEKEMATHSSVLAWRTPGTAEPGGLPSMGSHRVEHDWSDLAAVAEYSSGYRVVKTKFHWTRPLWSLVFFFFFKAKLVKVIRRKNQKWPDREDQLSQSLTHSPSRPWSWQDMGRQGIKCLFSLCMTSCFTCRQCRDWDFFS